MTDYLQRLSRTRDPRQDVLTIEEVVTCILGCGRIRARRERRLHVAVVFRLELAARSEQDRRFDFYFLLRTIHLNPALRKIVSY